MRPRVMFSDSLTRLAIGKTVFNVLILLFAFIFTSFGQEQKNISSQDTSQKRRLSYPSELFLAQPTVLPFRSYDLTNESFSDFLHQSLSAPMTPLSRNFKSPVDLQNSWKQELDYQQRYRTMKLILSSVQMGGTAYLLYLHLKKYGLK